MITSKVPDDFNSQNYLMGNHDKTEMTSGTWQHLATVSTVFSWSAIVWHLEILSSRVKGQEVSVAPPFSCSRSLLFDDFFPKISESCLLAVTEYHGCRHQAGCLGEVPMKWSRPFSCLVFVPPGWEQLPFGWTPCCHTWHPVVHLVLWTVSWSRDMVQRLLERTLGD